MPTPSIAVETDRAPTLRPRIVVALFAVAGLSRFAYFYLDDLTRQIPGTALRRALEEGTGIIAAALLFPIAVFVERRFPLDRGRWRHHWPAHLAGLALYSVLHTSLMAVFRRVLFPLFAHVSYDYGVLGIRYFMESAQDIVSYAVFIGLLTLIRTQQRLRDREVHAAQLERDSLNARLESLRLRLQPHFLFNALNTISSTVYENPVAADELIGRLGDLLRQSLGAADRPEITLGEELGVLHAYQAFIEARFGSRVSFSYRVDPAATPIAVPAFLLQPLVENGVHHGLSSEYSHVEIEMRAELEHNRLRIVIENTKPPQGDHEERIGVGLGATAARLRLLYGDGASIATENHLADRFIATIHLPARPLTPSSSATAAPAATLARADR